MPQTENHKLNNPKEISTHQGFEANARILGYERLANALAEETNFATARGVSGKDFGPTNEAAAAFPFARRFARTYSEWDANGRIGSLRITPADLADVPSQPDAIALHNQVRVMFGIEPPESSSETKGFSLEDDITPTAFPDIDLRTSRFRGIVNMFVEYAPTKKANPSGPDTAIPQFPKSADYK